VPAFFFISGLFAKRAVNSKDYGKVWSFIKLFFFSNVLLFLVGYICNTDHSISFVSVQELPWFMLSIASMFLITIIFKNIDPKYVLITSIVIALIAGYIKPTKTLDSDFLAYMRTINFFPYFYLGYVIDREKLAEIANRKWIRIVSGITLTAIAAVCFIFPNTAYMLRPMLTGRNYYSELEQFAPLGIPIKIVLFAVGFLMIFMLVSITPNRRFIFSKLGERTLEIYTFSNCFVIPIFSVLQFDAFMQANFPRWFLLSTVLLAIIIVLICSLDIFVIPVKWIMSNNNKLRKQED
ncbi:MAG: acyltransferase family protein, partial [Acutalibacteraceae bacterium]